MAAVKARGWIYLDRLPANTELGPDVAGRPGARSPWRPNGSRHELAPRAVQLEAGFTSFLDSITGAITEYAIDNPAGLSTWDEDLAAFRDGFNKGAALVPSPSPLDMLAGLLGVKKNTLLLVLALAAYLMLRQARAVPALSQVFT